MTKRSLTPQTELNVMVGVVDAMNRAEIAGISLTGGPLQYESNGRYTIEWDSLEARWTLVAETDDAIVVDSFNRKV